MVVVVIAHVHLEEFLSHLETTLVNLPLDPQVLVRAEAAVQVIAVVRAELQAEHHLDLKRDCNLRGGGKFMPSYKILKKLEEIGFSGSAKKVPYITDEPKIPYFLCHPNEKARSKYNAESSFGQGFHPDENLARIKSVGEFLERLCLDNPQKKDLKLSRKKESFIDPGLFCVYSEEQVPSQKDFIEECRNQQYQWYPVENLYEEFKVYIPAQLIFLSTLFHDEFPIRGERISTGTAFGDIGTKRALQSGLLESVERDACISAYLMKRDLPRIVELPQSIEELLTYLKRYNLEPYVFDATSDLGIPTSLTITLDRTGIGPAVEIGTASAFDYKEAIHKSVLESIQCRRSSRIFGRRDVSEKGVFSLDDRFSYWHDLNRIEDLDFLIGSKKEIKFADLKRNVFDMSSVIEMFKKRGYHVFVADITLPEIREKGFEVLKVIIPELHPMYLDERAKALYSVHYGEIKDNPDLKPHPLT